MILRRTSPLEMMLRGDTLLEESGLAKPPKEYLVLVL